MHVERVAVWTGEHASGLPSGRAVSTSKKGRRSRRNGGPSFNREANRTAQEPFEAGYAGQSISGSGP